MVAVESRTGKITIEAKLTEGIRPDCVAMHHGLGHWSKEMMACGKGANDGDPTGGTCLTGFGVKVCKA